MAGDPAALEAAVAHLAHAADFQQVLHHVAQGVVAGRVRRTRGAGGAQVELRQLTVEQVRDMRADRVRVIHHHGAELRTQARDLRSQRIVVGQEIRIAAARDFGVVRLAPGVVQRLVVEGGQRAQAGGVLARIQRHAAGIAVEVDHRTRDRRAHCGRAHATHEVVQFMHPPVGIAARQPRRVVVADQVVRQLAAGMREADDQWCIALVHRQPVGMGVHACGSTVGRSSARPCASAPLRTRFVAATMSGWK